MGKKIIKLPINEIEIKLFNKDDQNRFQNGSISTNLKEVCRYCHNPDCNMDCEPYMEHCVDRDFEMSLNKEKEGIEFREYNAKIDIIESFILSQACAGIDVESDAYLISLQTTLDAIGNITV